MSSYLPMSGFRATVCASTGDNQHNCDPTEWGENAVIAALNNEAEHGGA